MIMSSNSAVEAPYSPEAFRGYHSEDANQHRLLRALEADLEAIQVEEPETKRKRRQILHPIEGFFRRGWITERQFLAGMRFRDAIVASTSPARVTSTLTPFHDHGSNNESVSFSLDAQADLDRAVKSIKAPSAKTFVFWMRSAESEDIGLLDLGRELTGMRKHAIIRAAAVDCLHACLHDLAEHYQIR
jgi:hypothetical protein